MKNKRLLIILSCLFLIGIITSFVVIFSEKEPNEMKFNHIKAIAYFGVSALAGKDDSYTVFINEDGDVQERKKQNVEWGTIIDSEDYIIMNGTENIIKWNKIEGEYESQRSNCEIYAGYGSSSGYLEDVGVYYELFNQGFQDPSSNLIDYRSTIRWGNEELHYCQDIPVYSVADGNDDSTIYVITSEINDLGEPVDLELINYSIDGETIVDNRSYLRKEAFELSHSKIISAGNFLYVMYFQYADPKDVMGERQMRLLEINKNTLQISNDFLLHTYTFDEDPIYFPFNKDSLFFTNESLYYSTGYGEIYRFDMDKRETELQFVLSNYEASMYDKHENIQFKDDTVYFFHFDEEKEVHLLESYTLDGKKIEQIEITGIDKMLGKRGPEKFLFDLKVVHK